MSSDRQRALSYRQAQRCEDAREPRCTCRCGGTLHGAKRGSVLAFSLDDPHAPSQRCPGCEGRGTLPLGLLCQVCRGTGRVLSLSALAAALARALEA